MRYFTKSSTATRKGKAKKHSKAGPCDNVVSRFANSGKSPPKPDRPVMRLARFYSEIFGFWIQKWQPVTIVDNH